MKPFSVLFEISNADSAVDAILPVLAEIREKHPEWKVTVLSFCLFYKHHLDKTRLIEHGAEIWEPVPPPGGPSKWLSSWRFPGISNWFLFRHYLKKELINRKFDRIVVSNDREYPEFDLVFVARKLKITTILIQESIRKDTSFRLKPSDRRTKLLRKLFSFEPRPDIFHGQGGCNRFAAWGENGKDYFMQVGIPVSRITITGSTKIAEFLKTANRKDRHLTAGRFNFDPSKKIILLATNPIHWMGISTHQDYFKSILEVIKCISELNSRFILVIKPHRVETELFNQWSLSTICSLTSNCYYNETDSLIDLLYLSDTVLIYNSTVAVEAGLLSIPVGMIQFYNWDLGVNFEEHRIAEKLTTTEEVTRFITQNPVHANQDDLNYYVKKDGDPAISITKLIERAE